MADYNVTARFEADATGYINAVNQARAATENLGDSADKAGKNTGKAFDGADKSVERTGRAAESASKQTDHLGDSASRAGDEAQSAFDGAESGIEATGASAESSSASVGELGESASSAGSQAQSAFDGVTDGIDAAGISLDGAAGDYSNLGNVAESSGSQAVSAFDGVTDGIDAAGISLDGAAGDYESLGDTAQSSGQQAESAFDGVAAGVEAAGASVEGVESSYSSLGDSAQSSGSQAEQAWASVPSGIEAAGISLDGTAGKYTNLGDSASVAMQKAAQGIRDHSQELQQLGGAMLVIGGGITAMGTAAAAVGIQYNDLQQRTSKALEVMTGSAAAASIQMEELNHWMRDSPFPRETWLEAQQQLMAFGMEAEDVIPSLNGIQEAVAAIGGGNAEIMQLVDILGTIEGQGRITGQELQRLGQMGVDAATIMGEQLGYTGDEIREQITAGALDAETAITALTTGMTERFDGSAAALTDTWFGAVDLLRAAFRDISAAAFSFLVAPDGGGFLVDLANNASELLYTLGELPTPILNVAGGLGLAGGAAITAAGGFLLLAPQAMEAWDAFVRLSNATGATRLLDMIRDKAPGAGRVLRNVGRYAGVTAGALLALRGIGAIFTDDQIYSVEELDTAVRNLGETGASSGIDRMFSDWEETWFLPSATDDVNTMSEAMAILAKETNFGDTANTFFDETLWNWMGVAQSGLTQVTEKVEGVGDALAGMVNEGNIEAASNAFNALADEFVANGGEVEELIGLMPSYIESLMQTAEAAGITITEQEALQWALSGVAPASIEAAGGLDEIQESASVLDSTLDGVIGKLESMGLAQRDVYESAGDHAAAIDDFNAALKENGATLDENTEAGRNNRTALVEMIQAGQDHAVNLLESGAAASEATDAMRTTYDAILDSAEAMGLSSSEAEALARELMGIEDKDVDIDTHFDETAREMAIALANEIEAIPEHKIIGIAATEDGSFVSVQQKVDDLGNTVTVIVDAEGNATEVTEEIRNIDGHDITVYVGDDGTIYQVEQDLEEIKQSRHSTTMEVEAETEGAQSDIDGIEGGEATVDTNAETSGAIDGIEGVTTRPWLTSITGVPFTSDAENALDTAVLPRTSNMTGVPFTSDATSALDTAVLPRTSSMTGVPHTSNAEGQLNNTARPRSSGLTGVAYTAAADGQLNNASRPRSAGLTGVAYTAGANSQINNAARNRTATITVRAVSGGGFGAFGQYMGIATGGIAHSSGGTDHYQDVLPKYGAGGRLPSTGLGQDMILARNRHGVPTAWVDDNEWVINSEDSTRYHKLLGLINQNHPSIRHLASHADGGQAGRTRLAQQVPYTPPQVSTPTVEASMPSELTGTLYMEDGALLGQVRMAMKDTSVVRETSQQLASLFDRDRRGSGGR